MHELRWGGAPQYSRAFVAWLVEQHRRDGDFFQKARKRYFELAYKR